MKKRTTDREFPSFHASEHFDGGPEINRIPPEFNEVRPDINFFNEMPIADTENISGNGNPGEGDEPPKKKKKDRSSLLQNFLRSFAKGAASAFAVAALVTVTAEAVDPEGWIARKTAELLQTGTQRKAVVTQVAVDPVGYKELWNDELGAPHDYDYDHPVVITESSCTEEGSYVLNCRQCDHVELVTIPPNGHTASAPTEENRVEPTCTEDGGYEEVVICDVCHEEIQRVPIVLAALGHTPGQASEENRKEPTCLVDGSYDEVVTCTVCGEELERTTVVIPARGSHIASAAVEENRKDPTCTEDGGYDTVVYCSVCGDEIRRTSTVLAAFGHTASEAVEENHKDPTCTEDGGYDTVVYCSTCHEEMSRESTVLAAFGHTASEAVEENHKDPTCTEDGGYDTVVYCSTCHEEISRESTVLAALGHTQGESTLENYTEPTCTQDGGYDTVVYCTTCGEEISRESTVVEALGHTPGEAAEENHQDPTCTEAGHYDMVVRCTVCDEEISSERVDLDALGHTYTLEMFMDTPMTCDRCGEYALELQIQDSNTVWYSVDGDLIDQASAAGYSTMEFDCVVYTDEEMTNWIGGFSDYVTALSGTFDCDYDERNETLYFGITLRLAESTSSDDVIFVYPSQGKYHTYTPNGSGSVKPKPEKNNGGKNTRERR